MEENVNLNVNMNNEQNNVDQTPKLSQNAQKLKDLEDKMSIIESTLTEFHSIVQKQNHLKENGCEEILKLHSESKVMYDEFNKELSEKIKASFTKEFDVASREVIHNQNIRKEFEEKNIEQAKLIQEMQDHINKLTTSNKNLENSNLELTNELQFLKESYDDVIKENSEYKNSCESKDEKIKSLDTELKEMKNVIEKLTEIRVILNKYFSSHFETFTPQERRIIQEVGVSEPENNHNNYNKHVSFKQSDLLTGKEKSTVVKPIK